MRITRAVVPSLFTTLNMFCGFLSLIFTLEGNYTNAAWFIIIAAIFDSLDGLMARLTKSSSDFGVELDSLADVVSFGVAPSFLIYNLHLKSLGSWGILISAMPMVMAAMRLARFNVQLVGYDKDYFRGLPTPATAIMIASFILTYYKGTNGLTGFSAEILAPLSVGLSLLMVSTFKYDAAPKFSRRGISQHPWRFALSMLALSAMISSLGQAIFPIFVAFVITGPIRFVVQALRTVLRPAAQHEADENDLTSIDV
ncbi:MAG: CDP-diacylglycerol--serine O-phosphatidyltransferase [Ignavibacteriae bacterium]|nr:CDP-diacylglycerol--serine O-phosphatidyltransferase [Ignavibacteriota bacterium]